MKEMSKTAGKVFILAFLAIFCLSFAAKKALANLPEGAADEVKAVKLLNRSERRSTGFTVKARIYEGDEDEFEAPLGKGRFFLLDRDFISILKDLKLKPVTDDDQNQATAENQPLIKDDAGDDEAYLEAGVRVMLAAQNDGEEYPSSFFAAGLPVFLESVENPEDDGETELLDFLIRDKLKSNLKAEISINSAGIGKSRPMMNGKYYLFGYAKRDREVFVWNLPVEVGAVPQVFELDQYNADVLFDY